MSIHSLLDWSYVVSEQEYQKYKRYYLFNRVFIRLTPPLHKREAETLLNKWVSIAHTEGIDIAESIYEDYCSLLLSPPIESALYEAVKVITEADYRHCFPDEIIRAEISALALYRRSLEDLINN